MIQDEEPPMSNGTSSLDGRVNRLEVAGVGAFLFLIVSGVAMYLLLAGDIRTVDNKVDALSISHEQMRGGIKVMENKLQTMDEKLDAVLERLPAKK
jgi:hypothetical protein